MNFPDSVKKRMLPVSFVYDHLGFIGQPTRLERAEQGVNHGVKRTYRGGVPLSSADIETIHQASLTILENTGDDWEQEGSRDAAIRARDIARTILAQEENSYIPADVAEAIRKKYNIIIK